MTCIAELDDYSDFFFNDSFYFVIFPSVWVVPDRVLCEAVSAEIDLSFLGAKCVEMVY